MAAASPAEDDLADGRAALARGAWPEARSRLEHAVSAGAGPEALEDLSWAAWWLEDVEACLDARERAYHGYRERGDLRAASRMALWLGDDYVEFRGAHAVAGGWFARATRLLGELEPCPEHGWLAVFEAHAARERDDLVEARRRATEAQEHGRRHGALDLEMFAVATEGVVCVEQGEVAEGLQRLDEAAAAALSGEYENLAPAAWTCCLMLSTCELVRDYDRAGQWCRQVEVFSERMGARFLRGVCRTHYGALRTWQGDWDEAERELVDALDTLGSQRPSWRADALVRLGELRRRQGRLDEAESLFEQAGPHRLELRGLAALRLDGGKASDARDLLESALRHPPAEGRVARADFLELLVRALVALGDHELAIARLVELRSIASAAATDALWAAVHRCEGVLASATGRLEHACDRFADAVDRLVRSGAPVEAAAARLELAGTLFELGRRDASRREARIALAALQGTDAATERARAEAILRALDAPRGPEPVPDWVLTPRQAQVLGLIAKGLSDQQIAEQLVLSPHTVHRHVANIYTRMACSSRAEAVAKAGRLGLL